MLSYAEQIKQAASYIRERLDGRQPTVGLILGSGLGDLAEEVGDAAAIAFGDVPHFPVSTVEGHAGRFVAGTFQGKTALMMQGRIHYYEGYSMRQVALPVYVMRQLGIRTLVVTNAAGGMNRAFRPGDMMLIRDHINMTGDNPLVGANDAGLGPRFPDMSAPYDASMRALAHRISQQMIGEDGSPLTLQEGVYCGISGPAYMTPAELTMLAKIGGDAVGMSTVAEVIAARHCDIDVLGISCITDMAIGEELEPLSHEQVIAVANRTKPKFAALVKTLVRELGGV
ncbi:MAG: purine nucleoside phosphorylase [Paenibacillus sp.]|nr:purine nucleoside phosphorylase [Paenibacillus sp.]